jgi:nucleotide-binding universal stress UspA family protein
MGMLHGAPCSVAIAPQGYAAGAPAQIGELVVGFDGSPEAEIALEEAVELARECGAKIRIVTAAEPPAIGYGKGGGPNYSWHALKEDLKALMRERLDKALASLPDDVPSSGVLVEGKAETALVDSVGEDALLVLGSRAYGPLRRVLLGSVSTPLVRTAPCPVIVHPRPAKPHREQSEPPAGEVRAASSA